MSSRSRSGREQACRKSAARAKPNAEENSASCCLQRARNETLRRPKKQKKSKKTKKRADREAKAARVDGWQRFASVGTRAVAAPSDDDVVCGSCVLNSSTTQPDGGFRSVQAAQAISRPLGCFCLTALS